MPKPFEFQLLTIFFCFWRINFIMSSWVNSKNLLLGVHHVLVHILGIAYVDVSQCLGVVIGHTQS